MNELINQIAQKAGIGEDKARIAAETVISFLKSKSPAIGGQLDTVLQGGGEGLASKAKDALFGKKTA